jgi:hypothetical protein
MGYKRCHMTFIQVAKMKPAYQKEKGHENLVLTPWATSELIDIKLLASLTYPLKIRNGQPTPHPITSHELLLIDIRHSIGPGAAAQG